MLFIVGRLLYHIRTAIITFSLFKSLGMLSFLPSRISCRSRTAVAQVEDRLTSARSQGMIEALVLKKVLKCVKHEKNG